MFMMPLLSLLADKFCFGLCKAGAIYRDCSGLHIVPVPQPLRCLRADTRLMNASWKLTARATPFVFAFFMASIMAMLMCLVITAANAGIGPDYPMRVLAAYQLAMPTAFCCVLVVRPLVMRLVALTVHPNQ
ncbi:DUF2798 domain-containing protein [Stenotrophomonas sp.]|uniref:DUF2798 domain-containing protein n=1 Tax=Stenotrophomonas sp. TaxID=69392 RepID=UPI0028A08FE4|nr:DUF2798 domain-containing protein [Stenotrophomonas sp.]